jgi:hypothetical protein
MGDTISAFLSAIPSAAASPLAMIALLATIAAWSVIAYRVNRFQVLMEYIEKLPAADRIKAIIHEFRNAKIPPKRTAEEYLQQQKATYIFYASLALCSAIVVVFGMAIINVALAQSGGVHQEGCGNIIGSGNTVDCGGKGREGRPSRGDSSPGGPPYRTSGGRVVPTCPIDMGFSFQYNRCIPAQNIGGTIPCSQDDTDCR